MIEPQTFVLLHNTTAKAVFAPLPLQEKTAKAPEPSQATRSLLGF